jgi:lipooligosaccharide transport system ATP-binding protein
MEEAAQLCDRLIIVDQGRIVAEGQPADLIAAHVGTEVIEIYLAHDRNVDGDVAAQLAGGPWESERAGDVLYLYLRDGDAGRAALAALAHREFTHRRATLEDVFLRLTGHALRD